MSGGVRGRRALLEWVCSLFTLKILYFGLKIFKNGLSGNAHNKTCYFPFVTPLFVPFFIQTGFVSNRVNCFISLIT